MMSVAKLLEYIIVETRRETKGVQGNLVIVDYRHPEVALIGIMIGVLVWPRRMPRREKTETNRERRGRPGIV